MIFSKGKSILSVEMLRKTVLLLIDGLVVLEIISNIINGGVFLALDAVGTVSLGWHVAKIRG